MVAARSAAMGFNRLVDARMRRAQSAHRDARDAARRDEPRARRRSSSSSRRSCSSWRRCRLNPLCGLLSPVALAIVFWYSLAKRYTAYTQAFLGLAMAVAPVGGWLAAGGRGGCGAVAAGPGDRLVGRRLRHALRLPGPRVRSRARLHSIPVRFGIARSLSISRVMHVGTDRRAWRRSAWLRAARADLPRRRRAGGGAAGLRAVARQRDRSVAGEARLRSERLGRHPVFPDDGAGARMSVNDQAVINPRRRSPGMFDAIAGALRPAEHGAVGRARSLLAAARDRVAAADRPREAARRLHRHGGCGDWRGARARTAPRGSSASTSPARCWRTASTRCAAAASTRRVQLVRGDAMSLPVADAIGGRRDDRVRHPQRRSSPRWRARELLRVLKPGGRLAILEFGTAGRSGCSAALPLVFPPRPAADRPRRVAPRRRVLLPAGVGRRLSLGRRLRANPRVPQDFHTFRPGHSCSASSIYIRVESTRVQGKGAEGRTSLDPVTEPLTV